MKTMRNINAKYDAGKVTFDFLDLIEYVSDEEKAELIEALSCQESIIAHVVSQLVDGWTENGFHGYRSLADVEPHTAIEKAQRRIALAANDVARKQIEDLTRHLKIAKDRADENFTKYLEESRRFDEYRRARA